MEIQKEGQAALFPNLLRTEAAEAAWTGKRNGNGNHTANGICKLSFITRSGPGCVAVRYGKG